MNKHYVLKINPHAEYDWEKTNLRDPLTGERPDFATLVAEATENEAGSYLVAVNIEVQVLEKVATDEYEQLSLDLPKLHSPVHMEELMAS